MTPPDDSASAAPGWPARTGAVRTSSTGTRDDLADVDARIAELEQQLPADLIAEAKRLGAPASHAASKSFGRQRRART
jgi:hypothetical protein